MGNSDCSDVAYLLLYFIYSFLNLSFVFLVQSASCLVKDQDFRLFNYSTS